MTLLLANLPDDRDELAAWLDRQLVSDELPRVAGELAALHGIGQSAEQALSSEEREAFLVGGGAHLDQDAVQRLLTNPKALLDLQCDVLELQGDYWDTLPADSPSAKRLADGRQRLDEWLARSSDEGGAASATDHFFTPASRQGGWFRSPESRYFATVATAACLMIAFVAGQRSTPAPSAPAAWGWNKSVAAQATLDREAYLRALADSAEDWFNKRPTDPETLAERILTFRRGCSHLLLSDHPPLDEADSAWLRERCLAWAEKIDAQLLALEGGASPATVRDAMDEVVEKLSAAIRGRAA